MGSTLTYAWILIKQNRISDALSVLNQIVTAAPNVPAFRYHLAVAYHKNGDDGLAGSELKQALELAKTNANFSERMAAEALLAEISKIRQ